MPSFDDLARQYQQAQEDVRAVNTRAAQQRLAAASEALHNSAEAAAQREQTGRQASKIAPTRSRSRR